LAARFFSRISATRSKLSTSAIDGQSRQPVPPGRAHVEPLSEQADEDARFVLAEPRQRLDAEEQLSPLWRRARCLGAAVVVLDDVAAEIVRTLRHRRGIAVECRLVAEHGLEGAGSIAAIAPASRWSAPTAASTGAARRTPTPS